VLLEREPKPVIGRVLGKLSEEMDWDAMARFVQQRRARGETVDVGTFRGNVPPGNVELLEAFIKRFETYLGDDFRGYYEEWRRTAVDLEFLQQIGRILERPYDDPPAYLVGRREELVEVIVDALAEQPRRSLLLVGEHGVGKTALLRAALERLPPQLIPFEATASEINAGAMYVGELEGRIRDLTTRLEGHPVVWIVPGFTEVLYAGQHSRSPSGMLDAMLPHIERKALTVVGELDPTGCGGAGARRRRRGRRGTRPPGTRAQGVRRPAGGRLPARRARAQSAAPSRATSGTGRTPHSPRCRPRRSGRTTIGTRCSRRPSTWTGWKLRSRPPRSSGSGCHVTRTGRATAPASSRGCSHSGCTCWTLPCRAWTTDGTATCSCASGRRRATRAPPERGGRTRSARCMRAGPAGVASVSSGSTPASISTSSAGSERRRLLAGEAGLHVLEVPEEGREDGRADRLHAIVDVVASPAAQTADSEPPAVHARSLLGRAPSSDSVVRRYRREPAPLVRDSVRGYRTGRLDRVLAGDFDLF
jgi:hypothetical protein